MYLKKKRITLKNPYIKKNKSTNRPMLVIPLLLLYICVCAIQQGHHSHNWIYFSLAVTNLLEEVSSSTSASPNF